MPSSEVTASHNPSRISIKNVYLMNVLNYIPAQKKVWRIVAQGKNEHMVNFQIPVWINVLFWVVQVVALPRALKIIYLLQYFEFTVGASIWFHTSLLELEYTFKIFFWAGLSFFFLMMYMYSIYIYVHVTLIYDWRTDWETCRK